MGLDLKQLILIFLIVLLLFGGKKLPALARSIGQGISEFKKGMAGASDSSVETSEVYQPLTDEVGQETEERDITPPRKAISKPAPKKVSAPTKKTTAKKAPTQKTAAKKQVGRGKKA